MNLVNGKTYEIDECEDILNNLELTVLNTLNSGSLNFDMVVNACDRLVRELDETMYLSAMLEFGIDENLGKSYLFEAKQMFSEKALRHRLKTELGENYDSRNFYTPPNMKNRLTEKIAPLGVLLHVAAGNADGLPAFSVLEGLLTGNVNILKLPAAEGGISVSLLLELIKIEPSLAPYIYVFDYSSKDIIHINKLIQAVDAVVVWGGVEAISAFREHIPPNIRLIEWGHKMSFAYITKQGMTKEMLEGLAKNIAITGQLLCSSCQGIFIDSDDMKEINDFCEKFLPVLEKAVAENAKNIDIGIKSQTALQLYCSELETIYTGNQLYRGKNCSLTVVKNMILEPALQFSNAWVKPLPRGEILKNLRPYKNYLQTVGLLCGQDEKEQIADVLFKTGIVRICSGERMSATYCGAPHDGEYPLRRYTKLVCLE